MVALPDEFVTALGLPQSQRFPWDQGKGIYLLTAYHNVHCMKIVRQSLIEFNRGLPQTWLFDHVTHCLDGLLQTIQCEADDTPRYTTLDESPVSGNGQMRNCRSWDKMERWAVENSACYRFVHPTHGDYPRVNRYRFCPEGSPYIESIREYFADILEVGESQPE
ncbi:MAG: hypothetical protein M1821_004053 [Bathelium mastoideum]|nr:MAG: hypothetical protein M1821_004053 [Bathelium mastoideum]